MHMAEKMIRLNIHELTIDRIGTRKEQIKRDIRSMFCGDVISEKIYLELNDLLIQKYRKVTDDYFDSIKLFTFLDALVDKKEDDIIDLMK